MLVLNALVFAACSGKLVKVLDPKIKRRGVGSFGYLKASYDGEACYVDLSDLEFQKK